MLTVPFHQTVGGRVVIILVDLHPLGVQPQRPSMPSDKLACSICEHRASKFPCFTQRFPIKREKHSDFPRTFPLLYTLLVDAFFIRSGASAATFVTATGVDRSGPPRLTSLGQVP